MYEHLLPGTKYTTTRTNHYTSYTFSMKTLDPSRVNLDPFSENCSLSRFGDSISNQFDAKTGLEY